MDETHLSGRCSRCGRRLAEDAPEGLCAACLLEAAGTFTPDSVAAEAPTMLATAGGSASPSAHAPTLPAGELFGPYRVGRLLGRGGMGEVYEAEHAETGRRLAIKLLRGRLHDTDDRARFLLEGQLAASVSHPHTVYIFGSEEIAGRPVIAMELLPGGTLKDRVDAGGPMPIADAVAAVLDIVGGLDAAHASGILHRDIKPSNCFVDTDGSVKVGDFGLSISTLARDVQVGGGFQGTPQFAPPEQLRGDPLDVRADIYAVGATLYYLLTAHTPFDAPNLSALFEAITNTPAKPVRAWRPDVPAPLATVVHRCLAKDPRERPSSYAELAELLRPFSVAGVTVAPFGLRLVAGIIDVLLVSLPVSLANAWSLSTEEQASTRVNIDPWSSVAVFAYFVAVEGAFGTSLGKRLLGLRLRAVAGTVTWLLVLTRALVFFAPGLLLSVVTWVVGEQQLEALLAANPLAFTVFLSGPLLMALMFVTARRANGYAGLHDLASGIRVVARSPRLERRQAPVDAGPTLEAGSTRMPFRCGPFDVLGVVGAAEPGQLMAGFDPVLRRRVWIHAVPNGTPPVPAERRDLGRLGRLHWLTGRRAPEENWDAYEAPDGAPLIARAGEKVEWAVAKAWMVDLANELAQAAETQSMPVLALDRVWIRHDGHALLIDFRAPGAAADGRAHGTMPATPESFLRLLARHLRTRLRMGDAGAGGPLAMPRSAAGLIDRWADDGVPALDVARRDIDAVAGTADRVSRWRRAVPIALASVPAAMLIVGAIGVLPQVDATLAPERLEIFSLLEAIDPSPGSNVVAANRPAMEIYVAGRFGDAISHPGFWSLAPMQGSLRRYRATGERITRAHPSVTPEALEAARTAIAPDLDRIRSNYEQNVRSTLPRVRAFLVTALAGLGLGVPFIVGLVSSIIVPGGVMGRLLGVTVVNARGDVISRARSAVRVLIAWSPAIAWLVWLGPSPIEHSLAMTLSPLVPVVVVMAAMAAGAVWTIAKPARGLHDRLARTWVVPR
ncbi:MAG TPA: serine/threonine-protein kinase [Vicinamibacterales bacterium]|nr:serine/threonine-protein kinase [Vicinamibacterales bacterium]